jgi:hypothetical protein
MMPASSITKYFSLLMPKMSVHNFDEFSESIEW